MEQMTIFDLMHDGSLDTMSEDEMVEKISLATGIKFKKRDEFWGYEAKNGKGERFTVKYSNYNLDDNKNRHISCGYYYKLSGTSSPCDTLEEAISFFKDRARA